MASIFGENETRAMVEKFEDQVFPTNFFKSMFKDHDPEDTDKIQQDFVRKKELVAIDIKPGTEQLKKYRGNPFITKEYIAPQFEESSIITAERLMTRYPGMTSYDTNSFSNIATEIVTMQVEARDRIERAIELKCLEALVFGKVNLQNIADYDFKRRGELEYTAPVVWSLTDTAKPIDDLSTLAKRIRIYGKMGSKKVVMGSGSYIAFMETKQVKERLNFRWIQDVDFTALNKSIAGSGAVFQGRIATESYVMDIFTYPQFYEVPTGYDLANEGEKDVPYMPDDRVLLIGENPTFDLRWARNYFLINSNSEGANFTNTGIITGANNKRYLPFYFMDQRGRNLEVGVRARPVPLLTSTDGAGVILTGV